MKFLLNLAPAGPSRVLAEGARVEGRGARGLCHGRPVSVGESDQGGQTEGPEGGTEARQRKMLRIRELPRD